MSYSDYWIAMGWLAVILVLFFAVYLVPLLWFQMFKRLRDKGHSVLAWVSLPVMAVIWVNVFYLLLASFMAIVDLP